MRIGTAAMCLIHLEQVEIKINCNLSNFSNKIL
jgi:hypothetical protein